MVPLILASGSETRAKILQSFRIPFVQIPVDFDEEALDHTHPKSFVYSATTGKLEAARKVLEKRQKPILCADTVVTADGAILRKAKDEADARKILEQQSGNRVKILTCSALWKRLVTSKKAGNTPRSSSAGIPFPTSGKIRSSPATSKNYMTSSTSCEAA